MSEYPTIKAKVNTKLPTKFGLFEVTAYTENDGLCHLCLVLGDLDVSKHVLVRVHSKCLTGDTFGSMRCDCQEQLLQSLKAISEAKQGVLIYLDQEGRGIGLLEKLKTYHLQDEGLDTIEANLALGHPVDARSYDIAAQILKALKVSNITLLTNNPDKLETLRQAGLNVIQKTLPVSVNTHNRRYLETKKLRLGHLIQITTESSD